MKSYIIYSGVPNKYYHNKIIIKRKKKTVALLRCDTVRINGSTIICFNIVRINYNMILCLLTAKSHILSFDDDVWQYAAYVFQNGFLTIIFE